MLGCGLGAFLFLPFQAGLRQLAAAILIFSGSIAFFDTKFFPRRFFRPGLAAALLLLVQSAYLIARPIRLWALCVFCMGLTAAVTDLLLRRRDRLPLLLAAGLAFSGVLPVNKKLWSSTFVCVVGAYSLGMFALFYYLIDVRGWRRWTLFFRVVGLNSITIYLAQRIVGFGRISDFFLGGVASKCPEALAAVVNSAGYVAVCWLFLYFLYRKNVFLKV